MTLHQHLNLPRLRPHLRLASLLRLLALLGLFLLPIQMRAGAEYVHPHALLHLLVDSGNHSIDHHQQPIPVATDHVQGDHSDHVRRDENAAPDLPTFESIQMAAGGLAVTLVVATLLLIVSRRERIWPRREMWYGLRVLPEIPPPRLAAS